MNRILEAREAAGLSRREACEVLGAPYRTIQDWELGLHKCPDWIEKLIVAELQRHKKKK